MVEVSVQYAASVLQDQLVKSMTLADLEQTVDVDLDDIPVVAQLCQSECLVMDLAKVSSEGELPASFPAVTSCPEVAYLVGVPFPVASVVVDQYENRLVQSLMVVHSFDWVVACCMPSSPEAAAADSEDVQSSGAQQLLTDDDPKRKMPAYTAAAAEKHQYRQQVKSLVHSLHHREAVLLSNLNHDSTFVGAVQSLMEQALAVALQVAAASFQVAVLMPSSFAAAVADSSVEVAGSLSMEDE